MIATLAFLWACSEPPPPPKPPGFSSLPERFAVGSSRTSPCGLSGRVISLSEEGVSVCRGPMWPWDGEPEALQAQVEELVASLSDAGAAWRASAPTLNPFGAAKGGAPTLLVLEDELSAGRFAQAWRVVRAGGVGEVLVVADPALLSQDLPELRASCPGLSVKSSNVATLTVDVIGPQGPTRGVVVDRRKPHTLETPGVTGCVGLCSRSLERMSVVAASQPVRQLLATLGPSRVCGATIYLAVLEDAAFNPEDEALSLKPDARALPLVFRLAAPLWGAEGLSVAPDLHPRSVAVRVPFEAVGVKPGPFGQAMAEGVLPPMNLSEE